MYNFANYRYYFSNIFLRVQIVNRASMGETESMREGEKKGEKGKKRKAKRAMLRANAFFERWKAEIQKSFYQLKLRDPRTTNCYPFRIIWNSKKLLPQVVFFLECRERVQSTRVFPIRFPSHSRSPFFLSSSSPPIIPLHLTYSSSVFVHRLPRSSRLTPFDQIATVFHPVSLPAFFFVTPRFNENVTGYPETRERAE